MLAIVRAGARGKGVVVATIFERGDHLKICEPPAAPLVIQIGLAILQKDTHRSRGFLADARRVHVTAANVGERADVRNADGTMNPP